MRDDIKKIVYIAILVSLCAIFSFFDMLITKIAFPFMITGRIGLANIVVVYTLYKFPFKDTLILVILKSILVGFLFGGLVSFIVGFIASITSFFGMYCIYITLKEKVSAVGVSVVGGFLHIIMQLFTMAIIYGVNISIILYYGFYIVIASIISSIIIGIIVNQINGRIKIELE